MGMIEKLATSLGRRDEVPNVELAKQIVTANDQSGVGQLVKLLHHKDKAIQSDSIKVLYEIGAIQPSLIQPHLKTFVSLLRSKNNRMVWGSMAAIDAISKVDPRGVHVHLSEIMDAADKGSVITKDGAVNIIIRLSSEDEFSAQTIPLLKEYLSHAAINQLPMYAERATYVMSNNSPAKFAGILFDRMAEEMKDSKRKRIQKVLIKLKEA
jgi:hypothetical protein